ncbi:MAG TPA: BamA/TamA family outer membrane protein [Atribacteraceae bacterium]|nr:BamA/TamA family outer membrane protein [Atribacteraceae bacterium]
MKSTRTKHVFWALCILLVVFFSWSAVIAQVAPPVVAIRVEGHQNISMDLILSAVELSLRAPFNSEIIRNDINSIYALGYFSRVWVDTVSYPDGIEVIYKVEEFQVIKEIRIEGNTVVEDEVLSNEMVIAPGQVMNWEIFQRDLERIKAAYSNNGFLVTAIDGIGFQDGILTFQLHEGIIEAVVFEGLEKTSEHVVRRELVFAAPVVFDFSLINRSMRAIFNLGFFDDVTIKLEPGSARDMVVLNVRVLEKLTGQAGAGVGYNAEDGWLGFVRYQEINFGGNAQRVELRYEFGARTLYRFSFEEPWLFDTPTFFGLEIHDQVRLRKYRIDHEIVGRYEEGRVGGQVTLGRNFDEEWRWRLRYKTEEITLTHIEGEMPNRDGRINTLTPSIIYDTRNTPLNPSEGWYGILQVEMAGRFLGGDQHYTKYSLDLRNYIPAGEEAVVALRLQAGLADTVLPEYDQFAIGGVGSLRGYDLHEFQGDKMLLFNLEYRWEIAEGTQVVFFGDAGYAWDLDDAIDFGDIRTGYGIGLRVDTPIGPLSLDYGIGEDRPPQTYFSIGHTF